MARAFADGARAGSGGDSARGREWGSPSSARATPRDVPMTSVLIASACTKGDPPRRDETLRTSLQYRMDKR